MIVFSFEARKDLRLNIKIYKINQGPSIRIPQQCSFVVEDTPIPIIRSYQNCRRTTPRVEERCLTMDISSDILDDSLDEVKEDTSLRETPETRS